MSPASWSAAVLERVSVVRGSISVSPEWVMRWGQEEGKGRGDRD